ncbi:MAG: hypothetical protein WD156_04810 [Acidimicrobiia bacterium]
MSHGIAIIRVQGDLRAQVSESHPRAAPVAAGLFGVFALLVVAVGVMTVIAPPPPPGVEPVTADATLFTVGLFGIMAVGALVAGRHPANPIGWLLCGFCLLQILGPVSYLYAIVAFGGSDPPRFGAETAAWMSVWTWIPTIAVLGLALLLFPDGRPASSRWRWAVWIAVGGIGASVALGVALWPQRGVELLALGDVFPGAANIPGNLALALCFASFVAGAVSLVVRFLRSHGEERLQLKWLMFAAGIAASGLIGLALADAALESDPFWVDMLSTLGVMGIPAAMGVAIFKHRLYSIDRIISRTLSYTILTGVMAGIYAGSSLLLGSMLRPLTGSNELAVAGSTLAAAALFSPARRWIQSAMDRRFNRRRYDAAQTMEAFSARLRSTGDMETLRVDLTAAVTETLQPTHLSLWLRESPRWDS